MHYHLPLSEQVDVIVTDVEDVDMIIKLSQVSKTLAYAFCLGQRLCSK